MDIIPNEVLAIIIRKICYQKDLRMVCKRFYDVFNIIKPFKFKSKAKQIRILVCNQLLNNYANKNSEYHFRIVGDHIIIGDCKIFIRYNSYDLSPLYDLGDILLFFVIDGFFWHSEKWLYIMDSMTLFYQRFKIRYYHYLIYVSYNSKKLRLYMPIMYDCIKYIKYTYKRME